MNVLITGSTGFIGTSIIKMCSEKFDTVYLLSRNISSSFSNFNNVKIIITKNYLDYTLPSNINIIYHLAGNPEYKNGPNYKNDIFLISDYLFNQCENKNEIKCLYFFSSFAAIENTNHNSSPITENDKSDPITDYGYWKYKTENRLKSYSFNFLILRLPMTFGINMRSDSHINKIIKFLIRFPILQNVNYSGCFSILSVRHLNQILIYLLKKENNMHRQILNLKSSDISLNDIASMIDLNKKINLPWLLIKILPYKLKCLFVNTLIFSDEKMKINNLPSYDNYLIKYELKQMIKFQLYNKDISNYFNSTTVIFGGSQGLGLEFVKYFSKIRKKIIIIDKISPKLDLKNILFYQYDLSDDKYIKFLNKLFSRKINITEVIITAGVGLRKNFENYKFEEISNIVDINLTSKLKILHSLIKKKETKFITRFIVTSSSTIFFPLPEMSIYSALNSAIFKSFYSIKFEKINKNIDINIIIPSGMNTNFQKYNNVNQLKNEKLLDPKFVVEKVISNINNNQSIHYIGATNYLFNFLSRVLPLRLFIIIINFLFKKFR